MLARREVLNQRDPFAVWYWVQVDRLCAPLDEMSDIQSLSGSSSLFRHKSLASAHHTRATDDGAASSQGYLYPGDPRVIALSRSTSLRRTSSMTDLDEEFADARRRAQDGRPSLGFGLSLAGGVAVGEGSLVTVSSGHRLGGNVYLSPPPSVRRGSDKKSRGLTRPAQCPTRASSQRGRHQTRARRPRASTRRRHSRVRSPSGTQSAGWRNSVRERRTSSSA